MELSSDTINMTQKIYLQLYNVHIVHNFMIDGIAPYCFIIHSQQNGSLESIKEEQERIGKNVSNNTAEISTYVV